MFIGYVMPSYQLQQLWSSKWERIGLLWELFKM